MWTLPLPCNQNAISELETALTYKNGNPKYALSEQDKAVVSEIYEEYERIEGKPSEMFKAQGALSQETKDAIHDGYDEIQEKNRLSELRSRLLGAANKCPCCSIDTASQLDHHIPRSVYHAVAVYSSNLIPYCSTCNNKKRAVTNEDPNNSFLHAYYENLPDERFFFSDTEVVDGALVVNFRVEQIEEMTDEMVNSINFQMARVNLHNRLDKAVNMFLQNFVVSLEDAYGDDKSPERVKSVLIRNEERLARRLGKNDWRTSLLNSLANNEVFCDGGFISALCID
ncbi:MAG: HNH endonuclease [Bacteroidetes bacterium]|nr:MAG: HNH endonuclease [Bacteroidota bacterium]